MCCGVVQLLQQENHELCAQLDAAMLSLRQAELSRQTDLDVMQRRLDDVEARATLQQQQDQHRIDQLTLDNERLSEQLLSVSSLPALFYHSLLLSSVVWVLVVKSRIGLPHFLPDGEQGSVHFDCV